MGMPLTSYTLLYALCSNKGGYELEMAKKILEPFNLIAFILHIPEIHQEFDKYLNYDFDRLDHLTGPKFLFFSLCNPPQEWLNHARNRDYFTQLRSWETKQFLSTDNQIVSTDQSNATLALTAALGISIEELPCLVITTDFKSSEFVKLPTNQISLRNQIEELGYAANRYPRKNINLERIADQLRMQTNKTNILEITLAKALSEALSFIVAGSNRNNAERDNAKNHSNEILKKLLLHLQQIKKYPGITDGNLEDLSFKLSYFLSNIESTIPINLILFDQNNFEKESYSILKTALIVTQLFSENELENRIFSSIPTDLLDYTPGIICFSKVFEKEINLSIVQWIRKYLGINFPEYYNIPQPNYTAHYTPKISEARIIDFNLKRNNQLLLPGIGQSELVFNDLYLYLLKEFQWDNGMFDQLSSSWRRIREIRNRAGHTEVMKEPELEIVMSNMKRLESMNIFRKLTLLKEYLKGKITSINNINE